MRQCCPEKSLKIVRLTAAWWVEEQLLTPSSCLSPGRIKKLQKFIDFCLRVGDRANLKESKSTWRQLIVRRKVQNHNIKSSGHKARLALLDRGTGMINLRQLSFWYRAFSCEPTNYKQCLHPSVTYRSAHNNSFLTLRVIHELKISGASCEKNAVRWS